MTPLALLFPECVAKGSRLTLKVWRLELCSLSVVFFVRKWSSSRPQTFATVRNEVAKPPMGSAQKVSVV